MVGLIAGFIALVLVGLILYAVKHRREDPPDPPPEPFDDTQPDDSAQKPRPVDRPVWRPGDGGGP